MPRLQRDQRGTASVEIVVMLPLFVLLLLGVYHLHHVGSAALLAVERARGCAFQFAVEGCQNSSKGARLCAGVVAEKADQVEQADKARALAGEATVEQERPTVSDKIEQIPVLRELWRALFGEGSVVFASEQVSRFRRAGTDTLQTEQYMVCNTVSESWSELRKEQLCGLAHQLGIKGKLMGCD